MSVIQLELFVDHLNEQKARFFPSIKKLELVELKQFSSEEQLLSMSNFLKSKEYNPLKIETNTLLCSVFFSTTILVDYMNDYSYNIGDEKPKSKYSNY